MKKTLKAFCEYVGNENGVAIVKAVRRQIGMSLEDFFDELSNVSNSSCGAAGGYTGFIYYSETVSFWRKHRKIITEMMKELAGITGENLLESVMNYGAIRDQGWAEDEVGKALYGNYDENLDGIYNIFAWGALEEVAHYYDDWCYTLEH